MKRTLVILTLGLAGLAGCSAGSMGQSDSGGAEKSMARSDASSSAAQGPVASDAREPAADSAGKATLNTSGPGTPAMSAQVISTGSVTVARKDLDAARFDLAKLLDTLGGTVASEETDANGSGGIKRSRLVVRVPSADFDKAMTGIGKLGTLVSAERKAEDVTTQVLDVDARVRAQEASLRRVEALLARAKSIRDVISLESQLSSRQAELDSLKSQQTWLKDQAAMSTIHVYLQQPDGSTVGQGDKHNAFVAGLLGGWSALGSLGGGLAKLLGALLPFVVVLSPVVLIAWFVVRRRRPAKATAN